MTTPFIFNHLWQSSFFAVLAGFLAFALRKYSATARYWVWLSASLKFLMPFALLVSLGNVVSTPARHSVPVPIPTFPNTLVQLAAPFSPAANASLPVHAPHSWVPVVICVVWALGFLSIALARFRGWLGIRTALRVSMSVELPIPIRALITPGVEQPAIVGFLRPALVLPAQFLEHLNPQQLGAILTHELCHVRRRDNFFAWVHMVVEAIFWFNPLVWWVGSRMLEERELACDEEVLRMGCDPIEYTKGILKICNSYAETPLPCVSGVTGADVKKRLRAILAGSIAPKLNGGKKVTLAALGLVAIAAPILIGVLNAPQIQAQSAAAREQPVDPGLRFEVASVKVHHGSAPPGKITSPGQFVVTGISLRRLLLGAYGISTYQLIGPGWMDSEAYDVMAKLPPGTPAAQTHVMLQNLLVERFQIRLHREQRMSNVYVLTVARGGLKLQTASADEKADGLTKRPARSGRVSMVAEHCSLRRLAEALSEELGEPVNDETGTAGLYAFSLQFARRDASDPDAGVPLPVALENQLGLKLEPRKGPMEVLVIDRVEKVPTEN